MKNIIDKINDSYFTFVMDIGFEPKRLYLGTDEWVELNEAVSQFPLYRCRIIPGIPSRFMGMNIHKVKDQHHLEVG